MSEPRTATGQRIISQDYLVNPTFPMSKADILAIVTEALAAERSTGAAPICWGCGSTDPNHDRTCKGDMQPADDERSAAAPVVGIGTGKDRYYEERSAGAAPMACLSCGTKAMCLSYCHACYWRMVNRARLAEGTDR